MSVYSDTNFAKENGLSSSEIRQSPHVAVQREDGDPSFQPSSVDLHLGDEFLTQKKQKQPVCVDQSETYPNYDFEYVSQQKDDEYADERSSFAQSRSENQNDEYYHINPNEFVLATTQEEVHLDDEVVGFLWGRSSVGRLGLFVENAGLVDANFSGSLTLELFNASPNTIALKPDMRIVQMTVHELKEECVEGYSEHIGSKYDGQQGVTPSRLYKDFD